MYLKNSMRQVQSPNQSFKPTSTPPLRYGAAAA